MISVEGPLVGHVISCHSIANALKQINPSGRNFCCGRAERENGRMEKWPQAGLYTIVGLQLMGLHRRFADRI